MALRKAFVNGFNTKQPYRVRAGLRESLSWRKLISTQIAMQRGPFPGSSTVEHSAVNRRVASSNLARGANLSSVFQLRANSDGVKNAPTKCICPKCDGSGHIGYAVLTNAPNILRSSQLHPSSWKYIKRSVSADTGCSMRSDRESEAKGLARLAQCRSIFLPGERLKHPRTGDEVFFL